jgi:hypothetical protein
MATIQSQVPTLGHSELSEKQESLSDTKSGLDEEKQPFEREDRINIDVIGDVFADGPRLIDLGEDGKEKPICKHTLTRTVCIDCWRGTHISIYCSATDEDYALRLMSLEDDPSLRIFTLRCFLRISHRITPILIRRFQTMFLIRRPFMLRRCPWANLRELLALSGYKTVSDRIR